MFGLNKKELKVLRKLNTPAKIQDFINGIPINFESDGRGETCMSPRKVLQTKKCHCIEGAFLAAACILMNKIGLGKPLVVDMKGTRDDWDHVIAVFWQDGKWGAISKSNHAVLRYREPVYRDIRELVMSYFHEYTDDRGEGRKTLRSFSMPVDLSIFGKEWIFSDEDLWHIHDYLDSVKHYKILTRKQTAKLRRADKIERLLDRITEWTKGRKTRNQFVISKKIKKP